MKLLPFVALALAAATSAHAAENLRWTYKEDKDASLAHVLAKINAQTSLQLTEANFKQAEDRDLAYEHYRRYDQIQDGVRIEGMSIRVWTKRTGDAPALVQLEAQVEKPAPASPVTSRTRRAQAADTAAWAEDLARAVVASTEDNTIRAITSENVLKHNDLQRVFTIKAKHGKHVVRVDLAAQRVAGHTYTSFPQADEGEYAIPALVYPIYEEYGGQTLPRQKVMLKHLLNEIRIPDGDPYLPLRDRTYYDKKQDEVKGATTEGQAQGFWSMAALQTRAADLIAQIAPESNALDTGHALLQGRYVTINLNPDAFDKWGGDIWIAKRSNTKLHFSYVEDSAADDYQVIPQAAFFGKPLASRTDALHRDVTRHPQHFPPFYINRGFDEVQVYYAVSQMFDALHPLGFKDPELSTRTFDAYLYDPDISGMDNAYYTDDTINFATYSPNQLNMARDNTTIWHELGHGVMDRLMGTRLDLADTGGLSEGMADFVAEMVLRATNKNQPFPGQDDQRIINGTGFFLTNEVHDDGEAYGGAMKGILDAATAKYGEERGVAMVVDLVLEAMRLARDNPHLTAQDWFDRVLFADELGRKPLRWPGELAELIHGALAARNFSAEGHRADFKLAYDGKEIIAGTDGSRGHEIKVDLAAGAQKTFNVTVNLKDGDGLKFRYPVDVKVFFNSGPLQGAIDWLGEDQEPARFTLASADDTLTIPLTVNGKCDAFNRADDTCSDFAYVQIFNPGDAKPVAKKRFYLRIKPAAN